jgi:hypothetical protein
MRFGVAGPGPHSSFVPRTLDVRTSHSASESQASDAVVSSGPSDLFPIAIRILFAYTGLGQ